MVLAHIKARISLPFNTLEGPLRLRNVEFLLFDEQIDELLLSRRLLLSIVFDLERHLARVSGKLQDIGCSNFGFETDYKALY